MATREQNLRRLHALGKRLGLDHEALRAKLGIASLKDVTDCQLEDACRELQRDLPDRPYKDRPRTKRVAKGTIAAATPNQRRALVSVLDVLLSQRRVSREKAAEVLGRHLPGPWAPAEYVKWGDALRERTYSRSAASRAITQFNQIAKHEPGWRRGVARKKKAQVPDGS